MPTRRRPHLRFCLPALVVDGKKKYFLRNWDSISDRQKRKLSGLMRRLEVADLLSTATPGENNAGDLIAARKHAARYVLKAIEFGYRNGFARGSRNDARLFGKVAASASDQEWIRRFLDKDPTQSSFQTLFTVC